MASITLHIPDDLKAQMDSAGDGVDWSAAAQAAFEAEINRCRAHSTPDEIRQAIQDLLTPDAPTAAHDHEAAYRAGRDWALDAVDTPELERLSRFEWHNHSKPLAIQVSAAILGEHAGFERAQEFWVAHLGTGFPSDAKLGGFVAGAMAVWETETRGA